MLNFSFGSLNCQECELWCFESDYSGEHYVLWKDKRYTMEEWERYMFLKLFAWFERLK